MALRVPGLKLIRNAIKHLDPAKKPWSMLSLSYQDILATPAQLESVFEVSMQNLPFLPDSDKIIKWHKADSEVTAIPEFHEVMRRIGLETVSVDIGRFRGVEQIADQNYPLDYSYIGRFDVVLDNVAAHCFNVTQALCNIVSAIRPGGLALHITPLAMVNQGYYSISPCLFHDFYTANGFEILQHTGCTIGRNGEPSVSAKIDTLRRIKVFHPDTIQFIIARRTNEAPVVWPIQEKFKIFPDCKELSEQHPCE